MTDGLVLQPGGGHRIQAVTMTLKVGADESKVGSFFEADVPVGFDVGAHRHAHAEEIFYILEGELDLLAFEPRNIIGDWRTWESDSGRKVVRVGPGSTMFVPPGCPHAFANPGPAPVRMLLHVSPPGHEIYLQELADLLARGGPPDPEAIGELRARHDIEQLSSLGRGPTGR
jgi:oxalate decarboxylase/phosphoglucose isomerase-like protein (cupin superfamily)